MSFYKIEFIWRFLSRVFEVFFWEYFFKGVRVLGLGRGELGCDGGVIVVLGDMGSFELEWFC